MNFLAFVSAVLALPETGRVVPPEWLPQILAASAAINVILSALRRLSPV